MLFRFVVYFCHTINRIITHKKTTLMKIKVFLLALLLTVGLFHSCDDDDNDSISVPEAVLTAYNQKYATFRVTEWEYEWGYYKAEFRNNGAEVEAWFTASGEWTRTETDCRPTLLPQAVQDYLTANYQGYRIDDVNFVETPTGEYYEVELERAGQPDVYVNVTAEGQPVH